MEVNKKITKIVVNRDDELTDIVSGVVGSENERIVLTFAEDSDLLISPINLKVILETADEQEKLLILQVIKNPSGVRNATLAGLSVTDNPSLPTESMWENEIISRGKRLSKDVKEAEKNIREIEEESIESVQSAPVSDFQKRIDSAVEKSEKMVKSKNEDLGLTLDDDIPITYDDKDGVLGKDFSEREGNLEVENVEGTLVARKSTSSFSKFFASISSFVCKSIFPFFKSKFFVIFFVSLLLVGGLVLGVYYFSVIRVRVRGVAMPNWAPRFDFTALRIRPRIQSMPPFAFTKPMIPEHTIEITVMSYMFIMPLLPSGPDPITTKISAGAIVPHATPTTTDSTVPAISTTNTFTPASAATRTTM